MVAARPAHAVLDVNNAVAREFSAYPGLFPTVASKLVKRGPFKSKAAMYAALDSDAERAALRKYANRAEILPVGSGLLRAKT